MIKRCEGGGELNCPKCGQETKGIKLNGKLFCSFCGEVIKDSTEILEEAYEHQEINVPEISSATPEAKIIEENKAPSKPKGWEVGTKTLDTEKQASTEEVKKPAKKMKIENKSVKKHQRKRTDTDNFALLLKEPELESPKGMLIEDGADDELQIKESEPIRKPIDSPNRMPVKNRAETEPLETVSKENGFSLLSKEEKKDLIEKRKKKQEALTNYFKETTGVTNQKKKKKKNIKKNKSLLFSLVTVFVILIVFGGLVYYINFYALKVEYIQKNLEENVSFIYNKPEGVPAGYQLSYLSENSDDYVKYFYTFSGNDKKYISVKIEPTVIKGSEILDEIINKQRVGFSQTIEGDLEFWQTKDNRIYVIKNEVLYTFENSGELFENTFLQFAKETLL